MSSPIRTSGSGTEGARDAEGPLHRAGRRLHDVVRRPEFVTDVLQIVKTVVAATAAWWLAEDVLASPVPFLAPWVALLTVYPTVYQSLSRGVQSTVASWLGVGVSFLIGYFLGVELWTFALAILVGLAASRIRWIRDEGVAIATTAIFVLGSGFAEQVPLLTDRVIEVAVGAGVGMLVNVLLIPPLRDQQASRYVDHINLRMGRVMITMAEEFSSSWDTDKAESWFAATESMSDEINSAWQSVRTARESRLVNPRRHLPVPRRPEQRWRQSVSAAQQADYAEILERVDEGVSHLRHLTRTLREASYASGEWDERFRQSWAEIVGDAGRAIADPDAEVAPIYDRLTDLSENLSGDQDLTQISWPLYGSLITSVRHIVVIVDDVASAREARQSRNAE